MCFCVVRLLQLSNGLLRLNRVGLRYRPENISSQINSFNTFNVYGSVHRKNILIYTQQDATLHSLFYLETALHVSGGTITHHQERKQLYPQHHVFVTPLLLSAAIVEELELRSSSNSSTIAAGNSNCVTYTRCRYSCVRSWWWVIVPPETCRAVST